jgi:amino-acid N-acetyltransferase
VIFGCAALYPYADARNRRDGRAHGFARSRRARATASGYSSASSSARATMGLESIFVLTTRTMHWFIKRGFVQTDPERLPEARKRKYNWDRRSQVLVKNLE